MMSLGMLWVVLSIASTFVILVAKTFPRISFLECVFGSVPVGLTLSAWISFLVGALLSSVSYETCFFSTLAIVVYALCCSAQCLNVLRENAAAIGNEIKRHALPLAVLLIPFGLLGCDLFSSRYLKENQHGGINAGGSVWADMPIHMTFANSFLYGANRGVWLLNMQSPIFAGASMHYPFIPDYHMAVAVGGGSTMRNAAYMTGAALFIAFCGLLYCLSQRLTRSTAVSLLAPLFVVGAGGLGGFSIVSHLGWDAAIRRDPIQDLAHHNSIVWWFGFLTHVYLPQRGATWAYPLCLFVCLLGWEACTEERRTEANIQPTKAMLLVLAATLAAVSPLLQAHSFVFLAVLFVVLFLFDVGLTRKEPLLGMLKPWLLAGAIAAAISLPQVAMFRAQVENAPGGNGFLKVSPIFKGVWSFIERWWLGLGPTVFLFLAVFVWETIKAAALLRPASPGVQKAKKDEEKAKEEGADTAAQGENGAVESAPTTLRQRKHAIKRTKPPTTSNTSDGQHAANATADQLWTPRTRAFRYAMFLAAAVVFALAFTVQFQPWDRDNIKLFYLWLMIDTIIVLDVVLQPLRVYRNIILRGLYVAAIIVLTVTSTFSGYLSVWRELHHNYELLSKIQIETGLWIRNNTPPDAVVLTKDTHLAPSAMIGGRTSLAAYAGWLDSHGYDWGRRAMERNVILQRFLSDHDDEVLKLIRKNKVTHIHVEGARPPVGQPERDRASFKYLDGKVSRVYAYGNSEVYEVK